MKTKWGTVACAMGLTGLVLAGTAWAGSNGSERAAPADGCELPRDVALNPGACLTASGVRWKDPGLVRHYRDLTEISISNRSSWRVTNIAGEITWINADGSGGPITPFSAGGAVPAGGAVLFTKLGGTLSAARAESNAVGYRIRFTRAEISQ